ncbi:hypothetical protein NP493_625g01035 [Ridgeia piscesae]|uniref:Uncharacterized protein n=1 Tax=Ridgeia piscesae TaxID=27915 RepID=A0AAD9KSK4_RIDPI|nr:hypothetical protein NP493_625g01035 [Ridgeia piscesae]
MLKHSLVVIRSGANTPVPRDATAKGNTNYFEEQQYQLKRGLEQKMSRHTEEMESRRQVSHDSIQQLQRQLNNLEQNWIYRQICVNVFQNWIYRQICVNVFQNWIYRQICVNVFQNWIYRQICVNVFQNWIYHRDLASDDASGLLLGSTL